MKIKAEIVLVPEDERGVIPCSLKTDIEKRTLPLTIFEGEVTEKFKNGKINKTKSKIANRFTRNIEKIFADNFRHECSCNECGGNHAKLVVEITHENE